MSGRKKKPGWWHGEAADLFAAGWTKQAIAARFGVSYSAVYGALNKKRRAAAGAAYYQANRDRLLAKQHRYYAANRDKILARGRANYAANRAGRRANREKRAAYHREWFQANRHALKVAHAFGIRLAEARRVIAQEAAE